MAAPTLNPTSIRTDIVTRLTGMTTAAGRVYDSRKVAIEDEDAEFPAICVVTLGATQARQTAGPWWDRTEDIAIIGYVIGSTEATIAANLDTLVEEILDTLCVDAEWAQAFGFCESATMARVIHTPERIMLGEGGVKFELKYSVDYSPAPATLEDFTKFRPTTDTTEPDGADVSEREIEVPQ